MQLKTICHGYTNLFSTLFIRTYALELEKIHTGIIPSGELVSNAKTYDRNKTHLEFPSQTASKKVSFRAEAVNALRLPALLTMNFKVAE